MGPAIILIALIAYAFFSFKTEVKSDEMERLNIELAENIMTSDLVYDKSIFDPKKLHDLENKINNIDNKYHNIEMPFRSCKYGYYLKIESEELACIENENCENFCRDVCGLNEIKYDENCKCSKGIFGWKKFFGDNDCQCKKNDKWIENYEFEFGYVPDKDIKKNSRKYPVAIANINNERPENYYESVYPAKMHLTIYDSWLSRISCAIERAYALNEVQEVNILGIGTNCLPKYYSNYYSNFKCISIKKSDRFDNSNHICTYMLKYIGGNVNEYEIIECRYSEIPVFLFFDAYDKNSKYAKIIIYPIKKSVIDSQILYDTPEHPITYVSLQDMSVTNCGKIRDHPEYISKNNDEIGAIVLCLKSEKKWREDMQW